MNISGKQIICRHKRPLIKTTITWHKVEQMSWTDLPQSLSPFTSRTSSGNQCLSYDGDDLACGFHHQRQHHQQHHPRHQPPPGWRLPLRSAAPPLTTLPITTRSPSFRTWLRSAVSWWSRWWSMAMVLKMVVVYADHVCVFVFIWTVVLGYDRRPQRLIMVDHICVVTIIIAWLLLSSSFNQ